MQSLDNFLATTITPTTSRLDQWSDQRQQARSSSPRHLSSLGLQAEYAETEYGWIEPGRVVSLAHARTLYRVNRFWEKPALHHARALLRSGCLWNTFVTMGSAATFFDLLCSEVPEVVLSVTYALANNDLAAAYAQLPNVDFSRDVLAHHAERLLVLRDSGTGWADLGSPDRVFDVLAKSIAQPAWVHQMHGFSSRLPILREVL